MDVPARKGAAEPEPDKPIRHRFDGAAPQFEACPEPHRSGLVREPARRGAAAGEVRTLTIGPRRWVQVASVLEALGTGLERGSALVESVGRPARFLAYGVTNEGARPGEGSDDGTYLPGR